MRSKQIAIKTKRDRWVVMLYGKYRAEIKLTAQGTQHGVSYFNGFISDCQNISKYHTKIRHNISKNDLDENLVTRLQKNIVVFLVYSVRTHCTGRQV